MRDISISILDAANRNHGDNYFKIVSVRQSFSDVVIELQSSDQKRRLNKATLCIRYESLASVLKDSLLALQKREDEAHWAELDRM